MWGGVIPPKSQKCIIWGGTKILTPDCQFSNILCHNLFPLYHLGGVPKHWHQNVKFLKYLVIISPYIIRGGIFNLHLPLNNKIWPYIDLPANSCSQDSDFKLTTTHRGPGLGLLARLRLSRRASMVPWAAPQPWKRWREKAGRSACHGLPPSGKILSRSWIQSLVILRKHLSKKKKLITVEFNHYVMNFTD